MTKEHASEPKPLPQTTSREILPSEQQTLSEKTPDTVEEQDAEFNGHSETSQPEASENQENINYVTPYAFGVSTSIYGLPLAKPRKRLFAMVIDWIFIAMLTKLSYIIMFGMYAALLLGVAHKLKTKQKHRFARKAVRGVGFFCLFVFSLGIIDYAFEWHSSLSTTETSDTTETSGEQALTDTENDLVSKEKAKPEPPKLKDVDDYDWQWEKDIEEKYGDKEDGADQQETPELMSVIEDNLKQYGISFGWAAFYFSVLGGFFSGQTPGKKLMGIKIIKQDGTDLTLWEAFGRYGGYGAGFATGLLGFLQVYWDPNRQAIQDKISGTLVIDTNKERVNV